MATRNDVTGDELKSRGNSDAYQSGYDRIWGNKKKRDCDGAQHAGQTNNESEAVQPEVAPCK